jgi:medium-chain acyl-[acyl-carrier-protein] hydrolase
MSARIVSRWITCPAPNPQAAMRLFCLPFAGGGASIYRAWPAALPSWVEVCPVQLPGREERYSEPAHTSVTGVSRALARELTPWLDKPFAIFGHSMGALLAFETARALRHAGARMPAALLAAAYPAPQEAVTRTPIHQLPDRAFIEEMRRMEGTPEAVLANAELMAFMLPVLRADFEACDTYAFVEEQPLEVALAVYGGADDREVDRAGLEAWRHTTRGAFSLRLFPGGHFFVQAHRDSLLADIAGRLATLPV